MNDPRSKTAFYEETARKLMTFEQELERENYIEAVAARYHVGFDNLRKLVNKMAMKQVAIPKTTARAVQERTEKDEGIIRSQKLLLTWLIEYPRIYPFVKQFVTEEDFTLELYRTCVGLLFEQYEAGEINPAKIINHFTDQEEQRMAAALFHAGLELTTEAEREKALRETMKKIVSHSLQVRTEHLDPTDLAGLQDIIACRKKLPQIGTVPVTF